MAEFKLGRLKFVWKGDWAASANYVKDDIVNYGGKSFTCVQGHTAASNFYDDAEKLNYARRYSDNYNLIYWATATEHNSSHFIIERSIDGACAKITHH